MSATVTAALFAGATAVLVSRAVERFGGRVGGLLGTLPATIVPASLGIAAVRPEGLAEAMHAVPLGMFLNAGFLWLWRVLPPLLLPAAEGAAGESPRGTNRWPRRLRPASDGGRLGLMVVLTLGAWLLGASVVVGLLAPALRGGGSLLVGCIATVALGLVGIAACLRAPSAPKGRRPISVWTLVGRGGLAAVAVGTSVTLAHLGGPLAAGIAAVFPAVFLTTMVALWHGQGTAVQAGAVGPMMLGSTSVAAYALAASVALPMFGPWGAAVAFLVAACGVTLPAYWWLEGRRGAAA